MPRRGDSCIFLHAPFPSLVFHSYAFVQGLASVEICLDVGICDGPSFRPAFCRYRKTPTHERPVLLHAVHLNILESSLVCLAAVVMTWLRPENPLFVGFSPWISHFPSVTPVSSSRDFSFLEQAATQQHSHICSSCATPVHRQTLAVHAYKVHLDTKC